MKTTIGILLSILVATFLAIFLGIEISGVNIGIVLLALEISYLIFSFGTIKIEEIGAMFFFDKPVTNLGPGLYLALKGIFSVQKETGTVFQDELPADPEKIYRGDGKPPEGMFPPIRVKFGEPNPADTNLKDDPYNVAMVAEVVPVVSWHITDAIMFFKVMGTVANCRKIMADKATEIFGDEFATVTPAKATQNLGATSQKLQSKLEKEVEDGKWGIKINNAYVKPIIFSHELNTSVVGVSIAKENAKAVVLTAQGEKEKLIQEANGRAVSVILTAAAEKERLVKTGLAKVNDDGNIEELLPDANTRVSMEAVKELAKLKGTLVFGGDLKTMLDIKKGDV